MFCIAYYFLFLLYFSFLCVSTILVKKNDQYTVQLPDVKILMCLSGSSQFRPMLSAGLQTTVTDRYSTDWRRRNLYPKRD